MKIYLSILTCLLCACSTPDEKIPEKILPKTVFKNILKELHLAEAAFEINKHKPLENAKNELGNYYSNIYQTYQISEDNFITTLKYYSENPKKLEQIYTDILDQLKEERFMLDQ